MITTLDELRHAFCMIKEVLANTEMPFEKREQLVRQYMEEQLPSDFQLLASRLGVVYNPEEEGTTIVGSCTHDTVIQWELSSDAHELLHLPSGTSVMPRTVNVTGGIEVQVNVDGVDIMRAINTAMQNIEYRTF